MQSLTDSWLFFWGFLCFFCQFFQAHVRLTASAGPDPFPNDLDCHSKRTEEVSTNWTGSLKVQVCSPLCVIITPCVVWILACLLQGSPYHHGLGFSASCGKGAGLTDWADWWPLWGRRGDTAAAAATSVFLRKTTETPWFQHAWIFHEQCI